MARYPYTLKVTDFSGSPLASASPRARVRPLSDASGPDGTLSSRDIPVPLGADGTGTVSLVASVDTAPVTRYLLIVDWLTTTQTGEVVVGSSSEWVFTAVAGGGDIRRMSGVAASAIFHGPPWPADTPPGLYIDTETGDIGWKDAS